MRAKESIKIISKIVSESVSQWLHEQVFAGKNNDEIAGSFLSKLAAIGKCIAAFYEAYGPSLVASRRTFRVLARLKRKIWHANATFLFKNARKRAEKVQRGRWIESDHFAHLAALVEGKSSGQIFR